MEKVVSDTTADHLPKTEDLAKDSKKTDKTHAEILLEIEEIEAAETEAEEGDPKVEEKGVETGVPAERVIKRKRAATDPTRAIKMDIIKDQTEILKM